LPRAIKIFKDLSVIAKFELVDEPGTFVLRLDDYAWTLIGNVALAVGGDIKYVKVQLDLNTPMGYIRLVVEKM